MLTTKERECIRDIKDSFDLFVFNGRRIFITGATGLIGKMIVRSLLDSGIDLKITALVRDINRARGIFSDLADDRLEYIEGSVENFDVKDIGADYVIHAACPTGSKDFAEKPVEVINTVYEGTLKVLRFSELNRVKKMVFLSTMETYGCPTDDSRIDESFPCNLNVMSGRSSYPESKRLAENLCASFFSEYGVPVNVLRLTQTFGPGVAYDDGRVFADFARCAIENRDIVLMTKGETRRQYLYLADAVTSVFTMLISGVPGEAYNVSNEKTYCSIYEMAELVASINGNIKVRIDETGASSRGFAPTLHMNLDSSKIASLGWRPGKDLKEMFEILITDMKERKS